MINPVSGGTLPAASVSSKPKAAPSPASAPESNPATSLPRKQDTVELSLTAQIRNLKLQGQSLNQIAFALGLDAKTVASYLGETV
jgi:hypothetical protein